MILIWLVICNLGSFEFNAAAGAVVVVQFEEVEGKKFP